MGSQHRAPCSSSTASTDPRSLKMPDNPEIWKAVAMVDHFEKIQKLPDPVPGCPNFRRVPGYKVYCCGQPTIAGFEAALNKVTGTIYPKDGKIIWFNLRQEPDVYVNGEPICARPPNKIGEYAELGNITRDITKANEVEFLRQVEMRKNDNGGKLKVVDINKKQSEIEVKELKSLSQVIEGLKEISLVLFTGECLFVTLQLHLKQISTSCAAHFLAQPSTLQSLLTIRLDSQEPPPAALLHASLKSSKFLPLLRAWSKLFLA